MLCRIITANAAGSSPAATTAAILRRLVAGFLSSASSRWPIEGKRSPAAGRRPRSRIFRIQGGTVAFAGASRTLPCTTLLVSAYMVLPANGRSPYSAS